MAALVVAVVAVSTSAILIRLSDAPKGPMAFWRVTFTILLLAPLAWRHRTSLAKLQRRDAISAGLAGLALAAHFVSWFESVDRTTVAASVTLVTTQPAFVAVAATLLLDEPLGRRKAAGIAVALGGAGLMSIGAEQGTAPEPLLGNLLALTGAVLAAAYVLAGRSVRQRVAVLPYVTVVYSVCAVTLLAYVLALGDPLVAYPGHEWLLFLGMALGPGVFGHTVINWALEHVESSVVSVSLVGEPVGSTILALLILGEVPAAVTVLGGGVVLTGIYVTTAARRE
jgi:drug/metabolite transporter (DMT)-like permease